jgi:hypothetical protein
MQKKIFLSCLAVFLVIVFASAPALAQNVGIGTTTPVNKLHVVDVGLPGSAIYGVKSSTFNAVPAILGENMSTTANAVAVQGTITSTTPGGLSAGVYGLNRSTTANGTGVLGRHNGTGIGVHGIANNGTAVFGFTTSGTAGRFVNAGGGPGLSVEGTLSFRGIGEGSSKVLSSDALGNATWKNAIDIGWVNGTGTANTFPKWGANGTTLVNSTIRELTNGGTRIIAGAPVTVLGNFEASGQGNFGNKLTVQASTQYVASFINTADNNGISIQVGRNTPNTQNNFITFRNANGNNVGRIEGQTLSEWHNNFEFIFETTFFALDEGLTIAQAVAAGLSLPPDIAEAAVAGIEGAIIAAHYATWEIHMDDEVGVAYESGNGDYAEWLLKSNPNEKFSYGDIVGVIGGKISKDLTKASHFMVISKAPMVLGNMPEDGKADLYEKVAFLGQVPIKIRGRAAIGDYIVASELNDGFGFAVNPKNITLDQISRIAGMAWSESNGVNGFSYVNAAIGINVNDLTPKVKQIETENETLKTTVNGLIAYLQEKDPSFKLPSLLTKPADIVNQTKSVTDMNTAFKAAIGVPVKSKLQNAVDMLENTPGLVELVQSHAKEILDKKGVKYQLFDQTNKLVTDSKYLIGYLKEMGTAKTN